MSSAAMSKDVDIRAIFEDVHQVEYDDEEKFYGSNASFIPIRISIFTDTTTL